MPEWFDAADDAAALQQANQIKTVSRKCEVWQGQRLVGTLEKQRFG
jgi:hypothetical protein